MSTFLIVFLHICCLPSVATYEFISLNYSLLKKQIRKTLQLSVSHQKHTQITVVSHEMFC